jgi:hypothetical protein
MDVSKTLLPGDMGTRNLLKQYGKQLVCVRYRIDKLNRKRFTTVELIVDEKEYINLKPAVQVWVKIDFNETELRQQVKSLGAKWLKDNKVWEMKYEIAQKLHLKKRIIKRILITDG